MEISNNKKKHQNVEEIVTFSLSNSSCKEATSLILSWNSTSFSDRFLSDSKKKNKEPIVLIYYLSIDIEDRARASLATMEPLPIIEQMRILRIGDGNMMLSKSMGQTTNQIAHIETSRAATDNETATFISKGRR